MNSVLRLESDLQTTLDPQRAPATDFLRNGEAPGSAAQRKRFARLVEAATREISGRLPDYFSQFELSVPPIDALARDVRFLPVFEGFSTEDLELALVRGIQILYDLHVRVDLDSYDSDDVSMLVLHGILDAFAAVAGSIDFSASLAGSSRATQADRGFYTVRKTRSGVDFAGAAGEGRPLVILSNTGVSLEIWANLINDVNFRRPWVIVASRAGSLLEGGMPNSTSLLQDVADIRDVLAWNNLSHIDVLAWGNAARAAVELARQLSKQVRSVLLLSPSFYGARSIEQYPSPFEDFLVETYDLARKDAVTSWALVERLPETSSWKTRGARLPSNPQQRAESVLRLPPQDLVQAVLAPLSCVEYFNRYVERLLADTVYDVGAALREVGCPIVLLTGTNDAAVNTQLSRDLLEGYGHDVIHATLSGAGHHIQVLQYGYLRYLLDCLSRQTEPDSTARLSVVRLA